MNGLLLLILIAVGLCIFFLPTIIALYREHHYKWIIFGVNLIFGLTGVGYLVAFVWAVWPRKTAVFDVVVNDPTTNSSEAGQKIYGQLGSNVRAFNEAKEVRPVAPPRIIPLPVITPARPSCEQELRQLAKLKDDGIITEEEFTQKKKAILGI